MKFREQHFSKRHIQRSAEAILMVSFVCFPYAFFCEKSGTQIFPGNFCDRKLITSILVLIGELYKIGPLILIGAIYKWVLLKLGVIFGWLLLVLWIFSNTCQNDIKHIPCIKAFSPDLRNGFAEFLVDVQWLHLWRNSHLN